MKKALKVTDEEKRLARMANFRKKKPKKPKSLKSVEAMERYIERYNGWANELKAAAKEGKKIKDMKDTISGL
jgi:hypothetical protein